MTFDPTLKLFGFILLHNIVLYVLIVRSVRISVRVDLQDEEATHDPATKRWFHMFESTINKNQANRAKEQEAQK